MSLIEELALLGWLSLTCTEWICALLEKGVWNLVEFRGVGLFKVSKDISGAWFSDWAYFLSEGVRLCFNSLLCRTITWDGLGDLTTLKKSRLLVLKLIAKADWRGFCLNSSPIRHIYRLGIGLIRQLLHEDLSRLFFLNKLADFLGQVLCFEPIAHLSAELKTLCEVELVHVFKNFFLFFGHHTDSNCVEAFFIHVFLQFSDLVLVQNCFTLREFIVVLRAEVL